MKRFLVLAAFLFGFTFLATSQTEKVEWIGTAEMIADNTYEVTITATVDEGWYIYSMYMKDGGPIATSINFEGDNFEVEGMTKEFGEITQEAFDPVFDINIKKFGQQAVFTQIVKTNGDAPEINANINYMSCNENRCNPPRKVKVYVAL